MSHGISVKVVGVGLISMLLMSGCSSSLGVNDTSLVNSTNGRTLYVGGSG